MAWRPWCTPPGRVVPEVGTPEVREVIEPPYRVIYRVTAERVEIVAVVHESRGDVGVAG